MSTSRSLRTRPSKQIEEQPTPSKEMEEPRSTRNKTRSQSTEQPTPSEEPRSTRSKRRVQPEKKVEESTPTRRSKRTKSVDGSAASPIHIKEESEPVDQKVPASSSSEAHSAEKAKVTCVKPSSAKKAEKAAAAEDPEDIPPRFVGEPIPAAEARQRWPKRYEPETKNGANQLIRARAHYKQAEVDGVVLNLFDDVFVKGEDDKPDYIGKIMEFYAGADTEPYFASRWFYRAEDTVIKDHAKLIDEKRVFYSDVMDDNPLDCIVSKIKIAKYSPNMSLTKKKMTNCDFYCDMTYSPTYSTIDNLPADFPGDTQESSSTVSKDESCVDVSKKTNVVSKASSSAHHKSKSSEMTLLDLYSGCGAMSTGLCLGAAIAGVKLVTRWAVDMNQPACESLKINHPETKVRNEKADDFLVLLREWKKLCKDFSLLGTEPSQVQGSTPVLKEEEENEDDSELSPGEFEVDHFVDICFGDPNEKNKPGMHLKVRWKGYGQDEDTWEPLDELSNCQEKIREFVTNGYNMKILPLPGDVAVICGGPPCQGVSGFNRFRNSDAPLEDPKNHQLVVFMDIVNYLKPKYVLMENVVDILKFAGGYLGRYALSRLVSMNYQSRLGIMAAGRYGLPQYRMRAFLWGAFHTEKLPQYPLPTHDVVVRGGPPCEFELNVVAYEENQPCTLEKALCLKDAISDLPPVTNYEDRDEMPYGKDAKTEFQKHIRLMKHELVGFQSTEASTPKKPVLYDHRPLQLNEDDYQRVCHIPKKKGANFRDLPGVLVGQNNVVEWDENVQRVLLPSGKPLVPDYAMTFVKGKSKKPFARLWWDETVPTVVTRAEPHNQRILHPEQDRVLSVRENARLQGFPDYYKLSGAIKDRYTQVGNAVAVPVARALGYSLGLACQGTLGDGPLLTLPPKFPFGLECVPIETVDDQDSNS